MNINKKPPNKSLFNSGTYNIPIDVWNPWLTSTEVIIMIKEARDSGDFMTVRSIFEQAEKDMTLEELNAVKSACAEELIVARQYAV